MLCFGLLVPVLPEPAGTIIKFKENAFFKLKRSNFRFRSFRLVVQNKEYNLKSMVRGTKV